MLFYGDYLKNNTAVTSEEFNVIYGGLSETERTKWTTLSAERNSAKKAAKAASSAAAQTISQNEQKYVAYRIFSS
ncbi:hypothetical protein R3P38DRAFT_3213520 [Favolaschia claudopus]|uniref:Uncharacterized protein n=1 Tax=Favolaschia claudopus TaxID=2862362 RepID=A0AAW0AD68_9AGAR